MGPSHVGRRRDERRCLVTHAASTPLPAGWLVCVCVCAGTLQSAWPASLYGDNATISEMQMAKDRLGMGAPLWVTLKI